MASRPERAKGAEAPVLHGVSQSTKGAEAPVLHGVSQSTKGAETPVLHGVSRSAKSAEAPVLHGLSRSTKGAEAPILHGSLRRCFRIADGRHPIFDGTGAFLFGARWNSPGKRIIYAADSFAGAMLEMLVHTQIARVPSSHQWIEIDIPNAVSVEVAEAAAVPAWNAEDSEAARQFGDDWFASRRSLILFVPSIVTNGLSRNCLINQDHPELTQLTVSAPENVIWDARLFGRRL